MWVPAGGREGGAATLLLEGRVGRPVFSELGVGGGYAWSGNGLTESRGFGLAGEVTLGWQAHSRLAVVARGDILSPKPGLVSGLLGVELTL